MDTDHEARRSSDVPPTHPGAILREIVLPGLDVSKSQFARDLGIGRQTLYDLLQENGAVTPEMAVRLGTALGTTAKMWLNLQTEFDLWHARKQMDLSEIQRIARDAWIGEPGDLETR